MKKYFIIITLLILSNVTFSEQMIVVGEVFTESW